MANRMKEEEKNEKIIRGLLKLAANKRCINCNSLGPQYVCTTFSTFVCTNCSGVHREFTHRVKSISMAKFTTQEVNALQEGGNERAREIYFKEWDPHHNSYPDSSNIDRLRDFIKHVYEDKRFSGERRVPKPKADNEESNESRRPDPYRGGSRSPLYTSNRYNNNESPGYTSRTSTDRSRNNEKNVRYSYGEKSPGFDARGDYRRSQYQLSEFRVTTEGVKRPQAGSPNYQPNIDRSNAGGRPRGGSPPNYQDVDRPNVDRSSPPVVVRPVRDILGEDTPPLRIIEPPKPGGTKVIPSSAPAQTERTSSASSIGSGEGTVAAVQPKDSNTNTNTNTNTETNLISLIDFDADPEPVPVAAPVQPQQQSQSLPAQQISSPPASNIVNNNSWDAFSTRASQVAASANPLVSALGQLSLSDSSTKSVDGGAFNAPALGAAAPNNQGAIQQVNPQENPLSNETKPNYARKELPADFFTSLYPPAAAISMPGWQRGPPQYGMGYVMPYPTTAMAMPTYPQPQQTKSVNPFDLGNDPAPVQPPTYAAMGPMQMQGQMPNMGAPNMNAPPQALIRTSSFELNNSSPRWGAPQQMPFSSVLQPSQYMMQQVPNNTIPQQMPNNMMPPMMQQGGLGPVNTTTFGGSVGGNPFG